MAKKLFTSFPLENVKIKDLRTVQYLETYQKMHDYVQKYSLRNKPTSNQFWMLEHYPVYTHGVRCSSDNDIINDGNDIINQIPLVKTDRGGMITYHGPGQLIVYTLCQLNSKQVRTFVTFIEDAIMLTLQKLNIESNRRKNMPGVYIEQQKIASVGLRVKNGVAYHGLSLNVDMDLLPFKYINPCGYKRLTMTQVIDQVNSANMDEVKMLMKSSISELTK